MQPNFRFKIAGRDLAIAVVQDFKTNEVLMVAFIDKEAYDKILKTKKMHYFSTSRKKLWMKGEKSGNYQFVKEIFIDCDGDALVFKVKQIGGACHMGYYSCFFRKLKNDQVEIAGKKIFEPDKVYGRRDENEGT